MSCLRLGDFTAAEDALSQANILDHLNPKVWGWMTILCLTSSYTGGRRVQAERCYKEARRLGLKDEEILEEIGDLYSKDQITANLAIDAYSYLTSEVNQKHGEAFHKLADVQANSDRNKAIISYK
jgi:hypothetical protein